MLQAPESLLEERRRLGNDLFDEVWDGELHMVPPPSRWHQRFEGELFFILKPIDLGAGNHRLLFDFNNRGGMRLGRLNDAPETNDPTTAEDSGTGFVMERG